MRRIISRLHNYPLIWGILVCCLYWFLEALGESYIMGRGKFSELFLSPGSEEIWERTLVITLIIIFSAISQSATLRRIKMEQALERSEKKYREFFEKIPDGIAAVDMAGRIIECNSAFLKMLGYTFEEVRKLTYEDITPRKWHKHESQILKNQVMVHGCAGAYQKEYIHKNGTIFPVELCTYLSRDSRGNAVGMWAVVRDISARDRMICGEEASKEISYSI